MNRILSAVQRAEDLIATLPAERQAELSAHLTLSVDELAVYQEAKSLAQANGQLSTEEAMTVYGALNRWKDQSVATRVVVAKLMGELMGVQPRC